jgi:hypothetical protein
MPAIFNGPSKSTEGIGYGGYTRTVGNLLTPSFSHILAFSSQSHPAILNIPLFSFVNSSYRGANS